MIPGVDQVVTMLRKHSCQAVCVILADDLGDAFLYLPVAEQPVNGARLKFQCPLWINGLDPLKQGFPKEVVVTEPVVVLVQGDQKQVQGKQAGENLLAVIPMANGIAQGAGQAR